MRRQLIILVLGILFCGMGYSQTDIINWTNDINTSYICSTQVYNNNTQQYVIEVWTLNPNSSGTITSLEECAELQWVSVEPKDCTGSNGFFFAGIADIDPIEDCGECPFGASGHWDGNSELYLVCD